MLSNKKLLSHATDELKFCEDKKISPAQLISKCLAELETQGFLVKVSGDGKASRYEIMDQREKLKEFITGELRENEKPMNFDQIYRKVASHFKNFFNKDFVFKAIDELFQMGLIIESGRCTYSLLA